MQSTLLSTLLLLLSLCASAQHSFQKLDVNTLGGSGANRFTSFKGKTYFVANDSVHGSELWWTDGQSFGLVADITPGPTGSFRDWLTPVEHNNFVVAADKLFFPVQDATSGAEIYEYDGVNAPRLTAAMDNDTFGARSNFVEMNGMVYFLARARGLSPWGFPAGLYSFDPNTYQYTLLAEDKFYGLTKFKGKLYTTDYPEPFDTCRLYSYHPVLDTLEVLNDTPAVNPHVYKDALFYLSNTADHGMELYRYDGVAPARRITDIVSGPGSSFPKWVGAAMAGMGNKLYFMATDGSSGNLHDLYSYDLVTDNVQHEHKMASNWPATGMVVYARKLFIACDSNNNQVKGLYDFDGSTLVRMPYQWQPYSDKPLWLAESNGHLYFGDEESSTQGGKEVYVYTDSVALGVQDVVINFGTTAFPNPATSEATISLTLKQTMRLNVQLLDIQGRVVYATEAQQFSAGKQEIKMPVQQLATGNYIYSVMNDRGEVLCKGQLVKE